MFDKSSTSRHKNEARVTLTLAGEAPFDAAVFLKIDERLIDLLNDPRAFIPVRRADGQTIIVAKSQIVSILERPADEAPVEAPADEAPAAEEGGEAGAKSAPRARRAFDPYTVLRVAPDATTDEIKRAYKARMKSVHPDAIAALDLDADLARAANLSAQKVNHAYQLLMRERAQAPKDPQMGAA